MLLLKKTRGKKNMLVELPIWTIQHEKNYFLCISGPSAFYRHFVGPIPVADKMILQIFTHHLKHVLKPLLINYQFSTICILIQGKWCRELKKQQLLHVSPLYKMN